MKVELSLKLAILAAGFLLSGCDHWPGGESVQSKAIVGQWACYDGPIVTRYRFDADGSCAKFVDVALAGKPVAESSTGTWHMADDSNLDIAFSNGSAEPVQEPHRIKLAEATLIFTDDGRNQVFRRVN